jgi:alpha-tubulin suppressor-like RCC1 family protein
MNLEHQYSSISRKKLIFLNSERVLQSLDRNEDTKDLIFDGVPPQVHHVATGDNHCLALMKDGRVFAWGTNRQGQLGLGDKEDHAEAEAVHFPPETKIVTIAAGAAFSAAISDEGHLYTWGDNDLGRLALGDTDARLVPTLVPSPHRFQQVACGWFHMLALTRDGHVFSCGANEDGKLGVGDFVERHSLTEVPISEVAMVICAGHHSAALKRNKELWGWGWNDRGNLGLGHNEDQTSPIKIMDGVARVACGWAHMIAQLEDGSVYTWGYNLFHQLGLGTHNDDDVRSPVLHPLLVDRKIKCIGTGYESTWVIDEEGTLLTWGSGVDIAPLVFPGAKLFVPRAVEDEWEPVFRWLFLGRVDHQSPFAQLPLEVLFQAVCIF